MHAFFHTYIRTHIHTYTYRYIHKQKGEPTNRRGDYTDDEASAKDKATVQIDPAHLRMLNSEVCMNALMYVCMLI
jgi:hypothetical protein